MGPRPAASSRYAASTGAHLLIDHNSNCSGQACLTRKRNVADDWLNATLLGAAFDAHDCDKAVELAAEVACQGGRTLANRNDAGRPEAERIAGRGQESRGIASRPFSRR